MGAKVQIGDSVIFQKLNDEVVILNLASQQYYGLNRVGSEMWTLLLEDHSPESATAVIAEKYGTDPVRISTDMASLITSLNDAGLIRMVL